MNREIKFRGIGKTGEWVYGSYTHCRDVGETCSIIPEGRNTFSTVKRESVGQLTGLKDKNSKDIYEGDILEKLYGATQRFVAVAWDDGRAMFIQRDGYNEPLCHLPSIFIQVVGNIHENPELLNSEQGVQVSDTTESQ